MKKSTTAVIAVSTFGLGLGAGAVGMLAAGGTDSVATQSSSSNATGDRPGPADDRTKLSKRRDR